MPADISFEVTNIDHEAGCVSVVYRVDDGAGNVAEYPQNICGFTTVLRAGPTTGEDNLPVLRDGETEMGPLDLHDDQALLAALQDHAKHYDIPEHPQSGLVGKAFSARTGKAQASFVKLPAETADVETAIAPKVAEPATIG